MKHRSVKGDKPEQPKPVDYCISIRHIRPEFGRNVRFVSMYYAREKREERWLLQTFTKAFEEAHPTWTIEEVTINPEVRPPAKNTENVQIRVIPPDKISVSEHSQK